MNRAPDKPLCVEPGNGASDEPLTVRFEWSCTDPDGDIPIYDLYFSESSASFGDPVEENLEDNYYFIDVEATGTTYYWKVIARDGRGGETEGPVWNFTSVDNYSEGQNVDISGANIEEWQNDFGDRKDHTVSPSIHAVDGVLKILPIFPKMLETYLDSWQIIVNNQLFQEFMFGFGSYSAPFEAAETFSLETLTNGLFEKIMDKESIKNFLPTNFLMNLVQNYNPAGLGTPIKDIQDKLDELLTDFEAARADLKYILEVEEMPYNMILYPNEFDWDGDGEIEPDSELRFLITFRSGPTTFTDSFYLYDIIRYGIPSIDSIESIKTDITGGDAIFDTEFFFGPGIPDSPEGQFEAADMDHPIFDENDYIQIDKGDIAALLTIVDALSIVHTPLTLWDLQPDMTSLKIILEGLFLDEDSFDLLLSNIDPDEDGTITAVEMHNFIGEDFLTFRNEKSAPRLANIRTIVSELPDVLYYLADDLMEDMENPEGVTDYFLSYYADDIGMLGSIIEYEILPYLQTDGETITGPTIDRELGEIEIRFWPLFDSPENFSNIWNFVPDVGNFYGTPKLTFPDPTFGGLLENFPSVIDFSVY